MRPLKFVQMASKQDQIEFLSYVFQLTRFFDATVMQELTLRGALVTLFKSSGLYAMSGIDILVAD